MVCHAVITALIDSESKHALFRCLKLSAKYCVRECVRECERVKRHVRVRGRGTYTAKRAEAKVCGSPSPLTHRHFLAASPALILRPGDELERRIRQSSHVHAYMHTCRGSKHTFRGESRDWLWRCLSEPSASSLILGKDPSYWSRAESSRRRLRRCVSRWRT